MKRKKVFFNIMSNNDDFLRDFFKDQHINSAETCNDDTQKKSDENKKHKNITTRYSQSKKYSSAKEINLRKLFEGIEKEKNKYKKKRKILSKQALVLENKGVKNDRVEENIVFSQQFIEDIKEIEYKKIRKSLQEIQQKYETLFLSVLQKNRKQENVIKRKEKGEKWNAGNEEKIQKIQKNSLGNISTFGEIKKEKNLFTVKNNLSFTAIPQKENKKKPLYSSASFRPFVVQPVSLHSERKEEGNEEGKGIISQSSEFVTPFSSSFKKTEISSLKQLNQEKKKKKIVDPLSSSQEEKIFHISRTGKEYISDIWESHPERIPNFEIHSLSSVDEKNKIETSITKKIKDSGNSFLEILNNEVKKFPHKVNTVIKTLYDSKNIVEKKLEKSKKIVSHVLKKSCEIKENHAKSLQREWSLYKEMISSAHKYSKNILRKGDEKISQVYSKGHEYIEILRREKQQAEKIKKEQIAAKKQQAEKIKREQIAAEKQQAENIKREQIAAEKQQAENIKKEQIAAKKQQAENIKREQLLSKFSEKKGKIKISFIPSKAEIKEWVQIAGMVASVFIVGVIGLRLPGLMSQYESVLNADFFIEQQESVSFLIDKKENPFKNIKSLPVAGNISEKSETVNLNEFFNINPPDTRIVIPKIAKNIPILEIGDESRLSENWKKLESDIQKALQDGVVHYPGTALPGDFGNVFITGHSSYYPWDPGRYKDVFAALHNLEVGDVYYIFHKGKKYKYIITTRKIVPPSDVSVLDQDHSKKESTLMTCTPVGTAKNRLILKAEEVSIEY